MHCLALAARQAHVLNVDAVMENTLNKLNAKVLRARLMNDPNLEKLEAELAEKTEIYEKEKHGHHQHPPAPKERQVTVVPSVNAEGKLLRDFEEDSTAASRFTQGPSQRGNKRRERQTRDALEENASMQVLFKREKALAGRSMDEEIATRIMKDTSFKVSVMFRRHYISISMLTICFLLGRFRGITWMNRLIK